MADKKTPKTVEVTAQRSFTSNLAGNRAEGEKFQYDVENDPADLVKLGVLKGHKAPDADAAATAEPKSAS